MARLAASVGVVRGRLGDGVRGVTATRPGSISARAPAVAAAWKDVPHHLGRNGIPLIDGCAAWLECKLAQVHEAGDHDICVGEVENAIQGAGEPLILWDRSFWSLR